MLSSDIPTTHAFIRCTAAVVAYVFFRDFDERNVAISMVHWACRYCALENSVVDAATNKSFFEHLTREMMMVKRNTFVIQIIWKQWIDIIFQLRNREMFLLLVEYPVLYVNERVGD